MVDSKFEAKRNPTLASDETAGLHTQKVAIDGSLSGMSGTGTVTDRSGALTAGSASEEIMAANPDRKYLLIQNPVDASETLYVNFTTVADELTNNGSIELAAGGSILMEGAFVSTEAVNVNAVTTNHYFIAKEG